MAGDVYTPPVAIGSTDWNGGAAPAGGSRTGTATITMVDGTRFVVAHNRAEVLRKLDLHAIPPPSTSLVGWVSFDTPNSGSVRVVLNSARVANVQ